MLTIRQPTFKCKDNNRVMDYKLARLNVFKVPFSSELVMTRALSEVKVT